MGCAGQDFQSLCHSLPPDSVREDPGSPAPSALPSSSFQTASVTQNSVFSSLWTLGYKLQKYNFKLASVGEGGVGVHVWGRMPQKCRGNMDTVGANVVGVPPVSSGLDPSWPCPGVWATARLSAAARQPGRPVRPLRDLSVSRRKT